MAVIESRITESTQSFSADGKTPKRITYLVTTDVKMSEQAVFESAQTATPHPVPQLLAYLGASAYVTDVQVTLQREYNYRRWVIVVTGSELPSGTDPGGGTGTVTTPPLKRAPVLWLESVSETVPLNEDRDGNPLVNSAGQTFDEPLSEDRDLAVLVVKKYYATIDKIAELNETYNKSQNSNAFKGYKIGTVKYLTTTTSEPEYYNNVPYYLGVSKFLVDPGGFKLKLQSKGWKYYDRPKTDASAVLINARDGEEQLVTEPVFLAVDGTKLSKDAPVYYVEYDILAVKSYADFLKSEEP